MPGLGDSEVTETGRATVSINQERLLLDKAKAEDRKQQQCDFRQKEELQRKAWFIVDCFVNLFLLFPFGSFNWKRSRECKAYRLLVADHSADSMETVEKEETTRTTKQKLSQNCSFYILKYLLNIFFILRKGLLAKESKKR